MRLRVSDSRQITEQGEGKFSANRGEGIAVEEKKRRAAVKAFQKVDCLQQA